MIDLNARDAPNQDEKKNIMRRNEILNVEDCYRNGHNGHNKAHRFNGWQKHDRKSL